MFDNDKYCVNDCTRCSELVDNRKQIVNGTGPTDADILFVGEAPGSNEDENGEPFVGRSGEVLSLTLEKNNISRSDVRITNCVRCRPPDNRDPWKNELDNCSDYLVKEIENINPEIVVALGRVPSEQLTERSVKVTKESGEIVERNFGSVTVDVMICLHPAATLYDSSQTENFKKTIEKAVTIVNEEE